jgi:hypothetical protein
MDHIRNVYTVGVGDKYDFNIPIKSVTSFKVVNGELKFISSHKNVETILHIHNPDAWFIWLEHQPYTITNYDVRFTVEEQGLRIVVCNHNDTYSRCNVL